MDCWRCRGVIICVYNQIFSCGAVVCLAPAVRCSLHSKCGANVQLSDNGTVATRVHSYKDGVVFSAHPLKVEEMFKVCGLCACCMCVLVWAVCMLYVCSCVGCVHVVCVFLCGLCACCMCVLV